MFKKPLGSSQPPSPLRTGRVNLTVNNESYGRLEYTPYNLLFEICCIRSLELCVMT